jgi:phasin family protein
MTTEKNWFDPNTYMEIMKQNDMTKMFDTKAFPGFDTEALTEAQKKNVQAIVDANRVASEGYQALFKKQVEVLQGGIAQMSDAMKDASTQPMTAEGYEKRMEMAKAHFEKSVAVFNELSESARKANEDAIAIIQARFSEGVEEMKGLASTAMTSMKTEAKPGKKAA